MIAVTSQEIPMKKKKDVFVVASIRINKGDWDKFAKVVQNRSLTLREYIKEVLDSAEKGHKVNNRKL